MKIVKEKTCYTSFPLTRQLNILLTQYTHKHFCINKTSNVDQNSQMIIIKQKIKNKC